MSDFMMAVLSSTPQLTAFSMSNTQAVSIAITCANITSDITRYHDGVNVLPVYGDTVYTDASGTTPLLPINSAYYYKLSTDKWLQLAFNGTVQWVGSC